MIYFEYELIDLFDYRLIYAFFIGGYFILPFAIFYFVWLSTDLTAAYLFKKPNDFLSKTFKRFFMDFFKRKWRQWSASSSDKHIAEDVTQEEKNALSVKREHREMMKIEEEFTLLFRGLIASVIYYFEIPYFGNTMLLAIMAIILYISVTLVLKYQGLAIIEELSRFIREDSNRRLRSKITVP